MEGKQSSRIVSAAGGPRMIVGRPTTSEKRAPVEKGYCGGFTPDSLDCFGQANMTTLGFCLELT